MSTLFCLTNAKCSSHTLTLYIVYNTKLPNIAKFCCLVYTSNFQNYTTQAQVTDNNVLIGYYSARIPPELMCHVMSMNTISSTINEWYKKATHFQTQKDCTDEIAK